MVSEKKIIIEIVNEDDDVDLVDDEDRRHIIPIALGLSAGGLKPCYVSMCCKHSKLKVCFASCGFSNPIRQAGILDKHNILTQIILRAISQ